MRTNLYRTSLLAGLAIVLLLSSSLFAQDAILRALRSPASRMSATLSPIFLRPLRSGTTSWASTRSTALPKKDSKDIRIAFIKINDHQHIELFNEPPTHPPNMMSHLCFTVDDIEAMRTYLRSKGFDVKPGNGGKTRTGDYAFEIKDPDGMLVEFVQSLPDGLEAKAAGKFEPETRISTKIYHLGFLVGNSEKSMDFYGKVLGFQGDVARRRESEGVELDQHEGSRWRRLC